MPLRSDSPLPRAWVKPCAPGLGTNTRVSTFNPEFVLLDANFEGHFNFDFLFIADKDCWDASLLDILFVFVVSLCGLQHAPNVL